MPVRGARVRKSPLPASPQCGDGRQRVAIQRTADEIARPGRSPERFLRCGPTHGMVGHLRDVQATRKRDQGDPRVGGWHGGMQHRQGSQAPKRGPCSSHARPHDLDRASMACTATIERIVSKSAVPPARKPLQSWDFLCQMRSRAGAYLRRLRREAALRRWDTQTRHVEWAYAMMSRVRAA